jgi:hypothetical protein
VLGPGFQALIELTRRGNTWIKISELSSRPSRLGRLQDIEPIAVEEESVFPEQIVQLWNDRMVVGNGLGFELAQRSLDLCGSEFHRILPFDGLAPRR